MMNRLSGAARESFTGFLSKHLPERTKRLVFLASFSARLKGETVYDKETFSKLNQVMALVSEDSAMKLPVHLSKVIWHGRDVADITHADVRTSTTLTKERLQTIATSVLEAMPKWLRYDSDPAIANDIMKLLNNRNVVLGH